MFALRQIQKHIRGAGLAYGASIEVDEEAGLTSFKVWRSPDAYKAYKAAGDVVRGLADGSVSLIRKNVSAARFISLLFNPF
jgi:Zn-dependent M16 (insulinase) family peptidase